MITQQVPPKTAPLPSLRCENPVLIGGCASAGTTLLAHLLNNHPAIYCGPEWNLFVVPDLVRQFHTLTRAERQTLLRDRKSRHVGRIQPLLQSQSTRTKRVITDAFLKGYRLDEYLEDAGITEGILNELAEASHGLDVFADGFFSLLMQPEGKTRWAEKSPANCYSIEPFLTLYPKGQYIHIVRDGRDNAESLARKPGYTAKQAIYRWIYNNALFLPHQSNPRCLLVRYEDLVSAPEAEVARILTFLNESPEEAQAMMAKAQQEPTDSTRKADMHSHVTWHAQPHQPISAQNVGKWQQLGPKTLAEYQQHFAFTWLSSAACQDLCLESPINGNALLDQFGYSTKHPWTAQPRPSLGFIFDTMLERLDKHPNPYYHVRW